MRKHMQENYSHREIARPAVINRRAFRRLNVATRQIERPQEADANLSVVLGRVVQSPEYGRGYIAETEDNAVKVRFWKHGNKRFRQAEGVYPFELLAEVRPLKAPAEKPGDYCQHGESRCLCCRCAGLSDREIDQWKPYRSAERHIRRLAPKRYVGVRISRNDWVLTSRREKRYQCLGCERTTEVRSKDEPTQCPHCGGAVAPVAERFQASQFSPLIGRGAEIKDYLSTAPNRKDPDSEEAAIRGLYGDPNNRLQKGGTGYLRKPLDEPRSTRADAPEWLHRREDFFKTLKPSRSDRAEKIFYGFYLDDKTDGQIAETLGWSKDSVKKERAVLIQRGNRFFLGDPPQG